MSDGVSYGRGKPRPFSPYEDMPDERPTNFQATMPYIEWGEAPEEYDYYDFPIGPENQYNEEFLYNDSPYLDPWAYSEYTNDDIQNQLDNWSAPPAQDMYGYDPPPPLTNIVSPDEMDNTSYLNWDWGSNVDPDQIPYDLSDVDPIQVPDADWSPIHYSEYSVPFKPPILGDADYPGYFDSPGVDLDDVNNGPGNMLALGLLGKHKLQHGSNCRSSCFGRFETLWF